MQTDKKAEQINAILTWHHFLSDDFSVEILFCCAFRFECSIFYYRIRSWYDFCIDTLHMSVYVCLFLFSFVYFCLYFLSVLFVVCEKHLLFPLYPDFIFHKVIY